MTVVALRARRRRRVAAALVCVLLASVATGVVLWRSGAVDTRSVTVTGVQYSDDHSVAAITDPLVGVPLPLVDTAGAADRLRDLPLVLDAEVRRSWPGTVEVAVRERQPVAAVPAGVGYSLVDAEGVVVVDAEAPPPGMPVVATDLMAGRNALVAALAVLASLPQGLRDQVSAVSAASQADVRLTVAGKEVRWGGATDGPEKAAVLTALLSGVEASSYDVSVPGAPATRP